MTLESILERANLKAAWEQVARNNGAPGVDGMKAEDLLAHLSEQWGTYKQSLLEGKYRPQAVRRVEIPKPNGGVRQLGIPTVMDRFIQQATARKLDELYDPTFSESSYGFRQGRSAHQALDKALEHLNGGLSYIVEIDLEKFFDRVNHDRLMHQLGKRIGDKRVLKLVRSYLEAGVLENGIVRRNEEGTPQGGNLSPVLSNIVLDELDKELESRGHKFVRYADDISIYCASQRAAERVLESVSQWIEKRLKLKVNREKSGIKRPSDGQLLGFGFYHSPQGIRPRISSKSYARLKDKLKKLTCRSWSTSMAERLGRLADATIGWANYFGAGDGKNRLKSMDEWLRSRLRMCIWKQWKKVKTRMASLRKLGASEEQAYMWANTRKGPWRTAHSPILLTTISEIRLKQRGYVPLMETYTLRRETLMNRRDTRPVRPVV
jgi:group II intron reverse transcriptase/maturase